MISLKTKFDRFYLTRKILKTNDEDEERKWPYFCVNCFQNFFRVDEHTDKVHYVWSSLNIDNFYKIDQPETDAISQSIYFNGKCHTVQLAYPQQKYKNVYTERFVE